MTPDLTFGGSGDLVLQVTTYLARLNLLKAESSIFNASVESAVKEFQQSRGLTVTGVVDAITLRARTNVRLMLLGGEPMDGPRYIWWNFVSSSKDRIEAAKDDWKKARFAIVPGDEKDFIPLPDK